MSIKSLVTNMRRFLSADNAFSLAYKRLFSIKEFESDVCLQWFMGAVLFGYFVRFQGWVQDTNLSLTGVEQKNFLCWPFFPNCADWYFLRSLPDYSQSTFFMLLFGVMVAAVYFIYKKRWGWAHACILLLFCARFYFMAISATAKGNYDYYHLVFSIVLLFLPHKKFFGQLSIVMFYFLSTSAKIHPSWIEGGYFTAMKNGLPLFPAGSEPLLTNLVIFMEMIMAWFLFSSRVWLQRSVLAFFIAFHLYSGTLVAYLYPATVLPPLIILFGPWFQPYRQVPLGARSLPGWSLMALLLFLQTIPKLIPGDEKLTMEGNFYALYMFEANHQCLSTINAGTPSITIFSQFSDNARNRCDTYANMFALQQKLCQGQLAARVKFHWTFDHSINGGFFYRIVDEPDLCALTYSSVGRNSWIKTQETAPPVARALLNGYR